MLNITTTMSLECININKRTENNNIIVIVLKQNMDCIIEMNHVWVKCKGVKCTSNKPANFGCILLR